MTVLPHYNQFNGHHWETGSIHNALAFQGVKGPHDGKPLSEALLLGLSGGITFGYFGFHYEGYDPNLVILTRNSFDPMQTLLERLGVIQNVQQTVTEEKGLRNLQGALEDGYAAIVWADWCSLPYNAIKHDPGFWAMLPIVVYGHDGQRALIADRSSQPLEISAGELAQARARIKKDKFRLLTLDLPNLDKLPAAVLKGLWQCIRLFTEKPPRGTRKNFGLSAYEHWAKMLTNLRNTQSWQRYFPAGVGLFSAAAGVNAFPGLYEWTLGFGDGGGERGRYADFLEEAASILSAPALKEAGDWFRRSHKAWGELGELALPANVPILGEAGQLIAERARLFWEQGGATLSRRVEIRERLSQLRGQAKVSFPLDPAELKRYREHLAAKVLAIRDIEKQAVDAMQSALM